MKKYCRVLVATLVATVFILPALPAQAAALTQTQINAIVALLQSFGADRSVITNVAQELGGTAPASSCVNLTAQMTIGSTDATTGGQVSELQTFLQNQGYFTYTAGPKGYYGLITADAVGRYQVDHGIVPSVDSNDAGITGPMTRAAINAGCSGSPPPSPSTAFTASPTSGVAPLSVTFTFAEPVNSAALDFGEGTSMAVCHSGPPYTLEPCVSSGVAHTYNSTGTYTATLMGASSTLATQITVTEISSPSSNNP